MWLIFFPTFFKDYNTSVLSLVATSLISAKLSEKWHSKCIIIDVETLHFPVTLPPKQKHQLLQKTFFFSRRPFILICTGNVFGCNAEKKFQKPVGRVKFMSVL